MYGKSNIDWISNKYTLFAYMIEVSESSDSFSTESVSERSREKLKYGVGRLIELMDYSHVGIPNIHY